MKGSKKLLKESKKILKRSKKNAEGKVTPQGHRKKPFRNYTSRLARALNSKRAGKARSVVEMFTKKLNKNQTYLEILVPYLNNTFEEAIFRSIKIQEKHETMKLQTEKFMLQNT